MFKKIEVRIPSFSFVLDCLSEIPKDKLHETISSWMDWVSEIDQSFSPFISVKSDNADFLTKEQLLYYLGGIEKALSLMDTK